MNGKRAAFLGLLLLTVLVAAACGAAPANPGVVTVLVPVTATPEPSIPLEGTEWEMRSVREYYYTDSGFPLTFGDDYIVGSVGCLGFRAHYTVSGRKISIADIRESGCTQSPGALEQQFLEALDSVVAYQATEERLELHANAGETVMVYVRHLAAPVDPALSAAPWQLESLDGRGLVAGSNITLSVVGEELQGSAGCNDYEIELTAAGEGFLRTGIIIQTLLLCPSPEGVMEQEDAYLAALKSAARYRVIDERLEIADAGGTIILVFGRR
jgi:heat shock protein HslJ